MHLGQTLSEKMEVHLKTDQARKCIFDPFTNESILDDNEVDQNKILTNRILTRDPTVRLEVDSRS